MFIGIEVKVSNGEIVERVGLDVVSGEFGIRSARFYVPMVRKYLRGTIITQDETERFFVEREDSECILIS